MSRMNPKSNNCRRHCAEIRCFFTAMPDFFRTRWRIFKSNLVRAASLLIVGLSVAAAAHGSDESIRFEVLRFDVTGNSLLEAARVESILKPFAGSRRSILDIQRAVDALIAEYRKDGYKLVAVELPEQVLEKGVVQLNVIETRIGRVSVTGNSEFDDTNIRHSVPGLRESTTPNLDAISRALKFANESPAKKVTMSLRDAANGQDVDATLNVVEARLWRVSADLNNGGVEQTGKTRFGVTLQHANLLNRDHVASIQYGSTLEKPGHVSVYGMGYRIPVYALGDTIDLYGIYSDVNSGSVAAGLLNFAVGGKGTVIGARYNQTLSRTDTWESRLIYGVDHKRFKNDFLLGEENLGSILGAMPVSLSIAAQWRLADGDLNALAGLSRNLPGSSNGSDADFSKVRVGASANYGVIRFSGAYLRNATGGWRLRAVINGQLSGDALVPGEQIGVGGAASVRGLVERALAGDSGIVANLEGYSPNLCFDDDGWQCRVLAFHDAAVVRRNEALPGEFARTSVRSLGLGFRLSRGQSLNMDMDYGHVTLPGAITSQIRNRWHLRATIVY